MRDAQRVTTANLDELANPVERRAQVDLVEQPSGPLLVVTVDLPRDNAGGDALDSGNETLKHD